LAEGTCLFNRPHHQTIARILSSFDAALLAEHHCFFGGGTAIALRFGEFRESVDIDFLVSDLSGYRALRHLLTGKKGIQSLTKRPGSITPVREIRADQYGLRTVVRSEGDDVKFEIIFEARLTLDEPDERDWVAGVAGLRVVDLAASKLLANSDSGVMSRDVVDLAMMALSQKQFQAALQKAERAYGDSVRRDLRKALLKLEKDPAHLTACVERLGMTSAKQVLKRRMMKLGVLSSAAG
jgi:Nucleotidyl transferase AbiEii toxin, Type IV TA system